MYNLYIILPDSFNSFKYILRSGTGGSYSNSIFTFLGTAVLFSTVAACIILCQVHITIAQEFKFRHILANTCSFLF